MNITVLFMPILEFFLKIVLFACGILFVVLLPILLMILFWFIYYHFKGYRIKHREFSVKVKEPIIFKKLLFDFPRRFVLDKYNRNPDDFSEYGVRIIEGEQGAGKDMTVQFLLNQWISIYPKLIVGANCKSNFSDFDIESIDDIINTENKNFGVVNYISEIQSWWNSLESKSVPVEMISEICMQRKQYKVILGTCQVFERLAKPFREQTLLLYSPITIFGCLTYVRVYKPKLDSDGNVKERKKINSFMFVHTDELRNSYDTREKIKRLVKGGFKPASEQYNTYSDKSSNVVVLSDKSKKK